LDFPQKFPQDRLQVITKTTSKRVLSHITQWRRVFTDRFETIHFKHWNNNFDDGIIFTSNTSTFCALSVAVNLGYTEIMLYGADFKTHPTWNIHNSNFAHEKEQYHSFIKVLNGKGIKVYSIVPGELGLPQLGGEIRDLMETTYV